MTPTQTKLIDEVARKTAIEVVELNFEIVGDPHDRIAQAIKQSILEIIEPLNKELEDFKRLAIAIRVARDRHLDLEKSKDCNWLIELPMMDDEAKLLRELTDHAAISSQKKESGE